MNKNNVGDQSAKCEQCGGALVFDPVMQTMKCEYCESQFNIENNGVIKENDINEVIKNIKKDSWTGIKVLKCDSCGAQVVIQNEGVSTNCSFCGSSHIVVEEEPVEIAPDGIIPFTISKEMATEKFKKIVRRKIFIPKEIRQMNPENIKGVYVPYWTYDAVVDSKYNVEAGSYYYIPISKTRTVNGQRETYIDKERQTKWEWHSGTDNISFNDIIVSAFSGKYRQNKNCQYDFDFKMAKPYMLDYLSGYEVEKPIIPIIDGFNSAKTIMQKSVTKSIENTIHSDTYKNLDISSDYSQITYKLMLAPIWIVSYMHKGRAYQSIVNAQNGSVTVDATLAVKKVLAFIGAIIAAVFLLSFTTSLTQNPEYDQTKQNLVSVDKVTSEPCAITELTIDGDDIWVESEDKYFNHTLMVHYESPNKDDYKNIEWISSNPNVATIKTSTHAMNYLYGKISVYGKGETELYALMNPNFP